MALKILVQEHILHSGIELYRYRPFPPSSHIPRVFCSIFTSIFCDHGAKQQYLLTSYSVPIDLTFVRSSIDSSQMVLFIVVLQVPQTGRTRKHVLGAVDHKSAGDLLTSFPASTGAHGRGSNRHLNGTSSNPPSPQSSPDTLAHRGHGILRSVYLLC
jgi:hypothetical protein